MDTSENNKRLVPDSWKDKCVLVVDDMKINYEIFSIFLRKLTIKSIWAGNGLEAVEACKTNPAIDLVLMDIRMPVMNGYEATRKIKELEINPPLPVIATTAYTADEDRTKCLDAGCDDYMSKPISFAELKVMLLKYLK